MLGLDSKEQVTGTLSDDAPAADGESAGAPDAADEPAADAAAPADAPAADVPTPPTRRPPMRRPPTRPDGRGVSTLRVTQVKSRNGSDSRQLATLRSLGLRRIGHTVEHTPTPQIQGMVHDVRHLVKVEEA